MSPCLSGSCQFFSAFSFSGMGRSIVVVVFDFLSGSRHMLDWPGPNEAILIPVAQLLGRLVVEGFKHQIGPLLLAACEKPL